MSFWALFCALGCSSTFEPGAGGTYKVRIPISDRAGHYHLETVTLTSVTNLSSLSGSVVNLRVNGQTQEHLQSNGMKQVWITNMGTVPTAHFIKSSESPGWSLH